MFGYVNVYQDELKIKEFNKFKAYYCGLCKQLGKSFNQLVRLGLSYDLTFLALALDSVMEEKTVFDVQGCLKHIGKKKSVVSDNPAVKYAADMSIILTYYKLWDDIKDDFSVKSAIAIIPYFFSCKKLKGKYDDKIRIFKTCLTDLKRLENEKSANIDETAHTFASMMETVFDAESEPFKRLGYNIGRFIYIADAVDDYEEDIKKNRYNTLRYKFGEKPKSEILPELERLLMMTLAMAGQCYEEMNVNKNRELMDNIIYMGLRHRADVILGGKNGKSV